MSKGELADVVDGAIRKLHAGGPVYNFEPAARQRIVRIAAGFPWFVHVIGQDALRRAVDADRDLVTDDDVIVSTRQLVTNRFAQHFADAYQRAVRDSIQREKVLRTFAAWTAAD